MTHANTSRLKCDELRPQLEAYHDGELLTDDARQRVEAHLSGCIDCREEIEALRALDSQLTSLQVPAPSDDLRRRIEAMASPLRVIDLWRRPLLSLATAAVLIAIALTVVFTMRPGEAMPSGDNLIAFVEDHVAYVQAESAPDLQTSDHAELQSWFAERLDFTPTLPRWPEAELLSGRLCSVNGRRVARIHYRVGESLLSLFIQSNPDESAPIAGMADVRGHSVACWRSGGLDHVLVAQTADREIFQRLGLPD